LSLLRKETLHWRGESQGALSAWDFAAPNTLLEVIAWILTVHGFLISIVILTLTLNAGGATIGLPNSLEA
jgi:hypothetical protein